MKKILIVCGAGITSSLLAKDLNEVAKGRYVVVNSHISLAMKDYYHYQFICVAPQVKFMYHQLAQLCQKAHIPCCFIDFHQYTTRGLQKMIENFIGNDEKDILHMVFVKDQNTGYLAQLFVSQMVKELKRYQIHCQMTLQTLEMYQHQPQEADIYLIEPKLMFDIQEDEKTILVRTREYQALDVGSLISRLPIFPK